MRILLATLLLLTPGLAAAQVYKCVDKEGRVKYTQTKPKDADCSGNVPAPPPAPAEGYVDPLKGIAGQAEQRQAAEAKAREQATQQQAQKEVRCAQARARLATLERVSTIFTTDEKGERQYQTTQQNDQMREQARQSVATECG